MSGGVTNDRIDALIATSERQADTNEELALAMVEYQERAKVARRRFLITMALIALGFAGLYVRQEVNLQASQDARNRIVDCVDPAGTCFREGQARTREAVTTLNQVSELAAACAPSYVTLPLSTRIAAIEACVLHNLPH